MNLHVFFDLPPKDDRSRTGVALDQPFPCTASRKTQICHTGKACAAIQILGWNFSGLSNDKV
jgi:hypothetical protein